jgi:hypothetical protein
MKIIDIDIVVPILVKEIKPNSIIIPAPEILAVSSSSIEVSQSFQCDVDYVGGIVCDTDPQATEATFKKNPGTIVQSISGLNNNTDYYIKGVGLPELGNFTYGEGIKVHTLSSPIPNEYQLVEYLQSTTGVAYIKTGIIVSAVGIWKMKQAITEIPLVNSGSGATGGGGYYRMGCLNNGKLFLHFGGSRAELDAMYNDYKMHEYEINRISALYKIDNVSLALQVSVPSLLELYLFIPNGGLQNHINSMIAYCEFCNFAGEAIRKFYPVYRKSDSKPGMYDIVNNVFYINQGSGEFIVGPERDWQEN